MEAINIQILSEQLLPVLGLGVISFAVAMLLTPVYTNLAFKFKLWKKPRVETLTGEIAKIFTSLHSKKHKRNIPTMAGLIFILSVTIVTLSFNFSRGQTLLPLVAMLGAGAVGLLDDIINILGFGRGVAGLRSYVKFGLITLVALIGGWYFYFKLGYDTINIPFIENPVLIGILLIPLFVLVVVATSNAVNITDGLDGLAGGLLTSSFLAYALISFLQGHFGIAAFCITIVGALMSYTWFNIYPARFFMGDVGSFALGTSLGVVAMLTDTVFLLPIIGGMFVLEAGSSLLQVLSKKILKRKIFKVAPLHHHLEALGWPETKVTMRFWIVGQIFAVIGVIIAIIGGQV